MCAAATIGNVSIWTALNNGFEAKREISKCYKRGLRTESPNFEKRWLFSFQKKARRRAILFLQASLVGDMQTRADVRTRNLGFRTHVKKRPSRRALTLPAVLERAGQARAPRELAMKTSMTPLAMAVEMSREGCPGRGGAPASVASGSASLPPLFAPTPRNRTGRWSSAPPTSAARIGRTRAGSR